MKLKTSTLLLMGWFILYSAFCMSARADLTNCVITVNVTNKTVTLSSTLAIRETAYCAITGLVDSVASNLVLRITKGTNAYVNATSFSNHAGMAYGPVDLNTTEMVDFFSGQNPTVQRSFTLAIWDTVLNRLLVNADIDVQNNPYVSGMPGPSPIGETYMSTAATNSSWRVYQGNLQIYDLTENSWRTIMFRKGMLVGGPSNTCGGAPTNIPTPDTMAMSMAYQVPNVQQYMIPQMGPDGLWLAVNPTNVSIPAVTWGNVTGDIADQTDLQSALDGKVATNDAFYLSIPRTMTNWVAIPSSSNYFVWDPLTRTLSGCVSNMNTGPAGTNGVDGTNGNDGAQGPPGTNGADGLAASIAVAWTSNGTPGSAASVTNVGDSNAAQFGFMIPVGETGAQGPAGTNGVDGPPGTNGADGLAASIAVAWTSNGTPGSAASVTNVGDSNAAQF
ncbi:MAG: hypothetical protein WC551_12240, partial [Patescibacteria group bacterium]